MTVDQLLRKLNDVLRGGDDEDGTGTEVRVCLDGSQHRIVGAAVDGRGRIELLAEKVLPSVCVIDDDAFAANAVEKTLDFCDVTKLYALPDDTRDLEGFDVLVVDNQGIGNGDYGCGIDFLKDYAPEHLTQAIVLHSGFVPAEQRHTLEEYGVRVVPKGSGDDLERAVRCALGKTKTF